MTRQHSKPDIEVNRNPIERFLMQVKRFTKDNRKAVAAGVSVLLVSIVILIAAFVAITSITDKQRIEFEKLDERYTELLEKNDQAGALEAAIAIRELADTASFGFVSRMGHYYSGNYFYQLGEYDRALETLELFVKSSSKNVFWEMAHFKIGVIHQELDDPTSALLVFKAVEEKAREGVILDQLYYYTANLYSSLKDHNNARFYYNRLINEFPHSPYSEKARQRLFLLGAG